MSTTIQAGRRAGRYVWLGLGFALLLVANGRWIVPLASWFFAVGWLVFLDRSQRLSSLPIAFVAFVLAHFIFWWGIIPAPGMLYFLIAAIYAAVYFLPFVAHRLLTTRSKGFQATLIFPLGWVSAEFIFSRWITPYGSWGSLAYTQSEQLALLQLASLTGTAGISFLMIWFASVVAWMLRPTVVPGRRVRPATTFAVVALAVVVFGQLRLSLAAPQPTVRTAALVPSGPAVEELEELLLPVRRGEPLSESALPEIAAAAGRLNDDLLERSRREAAAGARLIAWSETAGRLFVGDQEAFLARAGRLATENRVVLLLGLGVWHPDRSPPFENKVVAVDPMGVVTWEYHKAHPIIGAESSFIEKGAGSLLSMDEEYGRIGAVICHDLDFPPLLRQASSDRIGLVVAPSADWRVISELHARMAVYRAVESGFTLLRPTYAGRSLAVDPRGRVIARVDFLEDAMVADVSVTPVRTLYGVAGDWFSWICLVGLIVLPVRLLKRTSAEEVR